MLLKSLLCNSIKVKNSLINKANFKMKVKGILRPTVLCLLFFSVMMQSIAQNRTIRGTVTDERNNPVAGASVTVKGSSIGTAADSMGTFSLSVPARANTLVISSVGYTNKEVNVNGKNSVTVTSPTTM